MSEDPNAAEFKNKKQAIYLFVIKLYGRHRLCDPDLDEQKKMSGQGAKGD